MNIVNSIKNIMQAGLGQPPLLGGSPGNQYAQAQMAQSAVYANQPASAHDCSDFEVKISSIKNGYILTVMNGQPYRAGEQYVAQTHEELHKVIDLVYVNAKLEKAK